MKVLITGVSGMLGRKVFEVFKKLGNEVLGIARKQNTFIPKQDVLIGDLSDLDFVKTLPKYFSPDLIIHTAAIVDLNFCEKNHFYTELLHIRSTECLANLYKEAKFIYISTDSVFDGMEGKYTELSPTNPSNFYAQTKLQGEMAVLSESYNFYILRLNIYGFHLPIGHSLFEWGINSLKNNIKINGFNNVYFNPLYSGQIANLIKEIIYKNLPVGIYNLSCNELICKYDFLMKLAAKFKLDESLIAPIAAHTESLGIKRPLNTTLKNAKIKSFLTEFDFSLESGFEQLYKDYHQSFFYENN